MANPDSQRSTNPYATLSAAEIEEIWPAYTHKYGMYDAMTNLAYIISSDLAYPSNVKDPVAASLRKITLQQFVATDPASANYALQEAKESIEAGYDNEEAYAKILEGELNNLKRRGVTIPAAPDEKTAYSKLLSREQSDQYYAAIGGNTVFVIMQEAAEIITDNDPATPGKTYTAQQVLQSLADQYPAALEQSISNTREQAARYASSQRKPGAHPDHIIFWSRMEALYNKWAEVLEKVQGNTAGALDISELSVERASQLDPFLSSAQLQKAWDGKLKDPLPTPGSVAILQAAYAASDSDRSAEDRAAATAALHNLISGNLVAGKIAAYRSGELVEKPANPLSQELEIYKAANTLILKELKIVTGEKSKARGETASLDGLEGAAGALRASRDSLAGEDHALAQAKQAAVPPIPGNLPGQNVGGVGSPSTVRTA